MFLPTTHNFSVQIAVDFAIVVNLAPNEGFWCRTLLLLNILLVIAELMSPFLIYLITIIVCKVKKELDGR